MSYNQRAQLELLNVISGINSESDYIEFRALLALYYARKAQQAIDALWDNGTITTDTINAWGEEHMRTPYRHAARRS